VYLDVCLGSIKGIINPIAFKKAPRDLSFVKEINFQSGIKTSSKA
jgi:hypothetical protein